MISFKNKIVIGLLAVVVVLVFVSCSKEENPIPSIPSPSIILVYPNGGESLLANMPINIKWRSQDVDFVNIEFSSNNGTDWIELTNSIKADLGEWEWTTPDIYSDSCRIKIVSKYYPTNFVESDSSFSIIVNAILELIIPNGGEVWESFTDYTIQWDVEHLDNLHIEFTSDNGLSWQSIDTVEASSKNYIWETYYKPSDLYKIKISSLRYPWLNDESGGNFSIVVAPWISEALPFYPLKVGNCWIYSEHWYSWFGPFIDTTYIYERRVTTDTIMPNGYQYFKVVEINHYSAYANRIYWERNDSVDGRTYRYYENWNSQGDDDLLIDNLWIEPGQTCQSHRFTNTYHHHYAWTDILSQEIIDVLGVNTEGRKYKENTIYSFYDYTLANNMGLIGWYQFLDASDKTGILKGCVIDGIVYGDTTTIMQR